MKHRNMEYQERYNITRASICVYNETHKFSLRFSQHDKYLERTEVVKSQKLGKINTLLLSLMKQWIWILRIAVAKSNVYNTRLTK